MIVDMLGAEILSQRANSNSGHVFIDVSDVNAGTYIATLQNQTGLIYKTIIVIIKWEIFSV